MMGGYGLSSYPGYSYKVKYFDKYNVCEKYDLSQTFLGRLPLAQLNYRDANSNLEIFFQTSTPPRPNLPMRPLRKIFDLDPYKQFCGKNVDLSVRVFNWLNTHSIRLSLI